LAQPPSLADVLREDWPGCARANKSRLSTAHYRAVRSVLACQTPDLGGRLSDAANARQPTSPTTPATTGAVPSADHTANKSGAPSKKPNFFQCPTLWSPSPSLQNFVLFPNATQKTLRHYPTRKRRRSRRRSRHQDQRRTYRVHRRASQPARRSVPKSRAHRPKDSAPRHLQNTS